MYTIDTTTGALTPKEEIGGSRTFGGIYGEGNTVVVDPSGRFAYVGQNELVNTTVSGGVSMNSIEATTGKLTSIETVDAAGDVLSLAVHPSGNFAYATADAFLSPRVSVYAERGDGGFGFQRHRADGTICGCGDGPRRFREMLGARVALSSLIF